MYIIESKETYLQGISQRNGGQTSEMAISPGKPLISDFIGLTLRNGCLGMRSPSETGAFTPSQQTRILPLFPSQLPWLKVPGKSRGRRGQPQSTRHEALVWMHLLWALLNFLDARSPSSSDAIRSSVKRSASGGWTATHESYARTMYAKVLNHCAFPRGTMDRGALKLNDLISRIQCSQYDPSLNFDDAVCGAMSVNPSRVSLPKHAGILDVI